MSEAVNAWTELARMRKAELFASALDARRVLRDERMQLEVALKLGGGMKEQTAEARRVREMWTGY